MEAMNGDHLEVVALVAIIALLNEKHLVSRCRVSCF
jgi:hypothetical protein